MFLRENSRTLVGEAKIEKDFSSHRDYSMPNADRRVSVSEDRDAYESD